MYCKTCDKDKQPKEYRKHRLVCKKCENKQTIKKRKERIEKGLCSYCSANKLSDSRLCLNHFFYFSMNYSFKSSKKHADKLKAIWEKQDRRCVYTDIPLIPGVNLGFDHIKSRARYPELATNYDNIQCVDRRINTMKNSLDHDEFVSLCQKVMEKYLGT